MTAALELVTYGMVGIGLAASCGFRVFVPMLVMSIAVKAGKLSLAEGWEWMGSWGAIASFGLATAAEVGGYYIPWLDNALDVVSSPAAVVAGVVATAACVSKADPLLQWSVAIIAGGGIAGAIQSGTVLIRGGSTATTGGLGNFVVSTIELCLSFVVSLLAVLFAPLACLAIAGVGYLMVRRILRRRKALADQAALS